MSIYIYMYAYIIISRNICIDPWQDFVAAEALELLCEQPLLFQDVTTEWFLAAECRGGTGRQRPVYPSPSHGNGM